MVYGIGIRRMFVHGMYEMEKPIAILRYQFDVWVQSLSSKGTPFQVL